MTNSIPEIRDADFLFVIGSNTTEAHPIIAMEMKRAVHRGATLVVADPRAIWLSDIATLHMQLEPGTDVWLLNAMAHVIIAEDLVDHAFVAQHTEGYEAVVEAVRDYTPEAAEEITGVPAEHIRQAARAYATTEKAGIYYTLGITEHTHGTDNVYGLANLVLLTGHLGKRSAGLNPLRGQNNVQGANDAGASPVFYPGYQRVEDPTARMRFEQAWGVALSPTNGLTLPRMMQAMGEGSIKALYVMGEDIVLSEPDASELEEGLNDIEFMVVQDIFLNETCRYADVVLPAACFAEKDGVFTNSDRRVQRVRKAVSPPGEARADWEILCEIARRVGYPMPHYESPAEVYAEMAGLCDKFSGISHERLERDTRGLQWPCPDAEHPGTPTLHVDGPMRGKAQLTAISYRPSAERPDKSYPFVLSTGRMLYHYNAATQTRREAAGSIKAPENYLQIHPGDAFRMGVQDGERVKISSRRGEVEAVARVTRDVKRGCVWMPLHFAEARANLLTNSAGDVVTGTAEYKVCAVKVEKLSAERAAK
ncbi:MAG: molybdopterin-dependent oxidoreductase [Alphaproteobacteria bacterium]|nr:molybdopterin-dependent oxidoreductase [Alphaproteobacteria bacterium]MCB9794739.1 molybdopterin-dependent oxidoreductase [Alphaproteobacteria bacterium]